MLAAKWRAASVTCLVCAPGSMLIPHLCPEFQSLLFQPGRLVTFVTQAERKSSEKASTGLKIELRDKMELLIIGVIEHFAQGDFACC